MFGIAFDLDYKTADRLHPRGSRQAYKNLEKALGRHGFRRVQQSFFLSPSNDLAALVFAIEAVKALPWLAEAVRDIRAFRLENDSNFTSFIKEPRP